MMDTRRLKKLLRDINSEDPSIRKKAAEALAEGDERAIYPLIKALKDDNPGVQDAAMRSLIQIGGEVTAYMVLPLLREDALTRNTAMLILKEIASLELISTLFNDKDDDVRKFSVDLISEIGDPEGCMYLSRLANDPNPNVRAAVVAAIGKLGCCELRDHLRVALKDDEWVCFSALESIAMLKDTSFVEDLKELLSTGSETIRFAVIETLGQIGTHEAGEVLKEFILKASEEEKKIAIKSLIKIGLTPAEQSLSDLLLELLRSEDREEMLIGLKGLSAIKYCDAVADIVDRGGSIDPLDPDESDQIEIFIDALSEMGCTKELIKVLQSDDIRYRGKVIAIHALGRLGSREAVPVLVEMVKSPIRDIRRAGVEALGELGGEETIPSLLSATDDPDGHVRKAAVRALGEIGDPKAFEPILELLNVEPYRDVKEEAVKALIKIDEQRFIEKMDSYDQLIREMIAQFSNDEKVVIRLARDQNQDVRIAAIRRLGLFASEQAINTLKEVSRDSDPEVRRAAVQSMLDAGCSSEEFIPLLGDSDMWVRFYALKALSMGDLDRNLDLIVPMLKDTDIPVVMEAIDTLLPYSDREEIRTALEQLREHPEASVKERVLEVLG